MQHRRQGDAVLKPRRERSYLDRSMQQRSGARRQGKFASQSSAHPTGNLAETWHEQLFTDTILLAVALEWMEYRAWVSSSNNVPE